MGKLFVSVFVMLVAFVSAGPGFAGGVEASAVFDRLKSFAGTWEGTPEAQGEIQAEAHEDTKVRDGHTPRLDATENDVKRLGLAAFSDAGAGHSASP